MLYYNFLECDCKGPDQICNPVSGECNCPDNTIGRICEPCFCNTNSAQCTRNGTCVNCTANTVGNNCEKCKFDHYGNALIGDCTGKLCVVLYLIGDCTGKLCVVLY